MRAFAASTAVVDVTGSNLTIAYLVLGVAVVALAIAYGLRAQVLAQGEGTANMKEIAAGSEPKYLPKVRALPT